MIKNKLKALTLLIGLCVGLNSNTFAQDAQFTQVFSNPLFLNPAYAGSLKCSRIAFNYRNIWPTIYKYDSYVFSTSYDQYVDNLSGGVGVQFFSDKIGSGLVKTNFISGAYAYNLNINQNFHIRPAFNIGMGIKQVDWSKIASPPSTDSTTSSNYFNVGTGLLVVYKNLISGISFDHINRPNIDLYGTYKLPSKLVIHCNYKFDIQEKMFLTPGIIFSKQDEFEDVFLNLMLNFKYLKFGVGYIQRFQNVDTAIGIIGYYNDWMSIGLSYDYTISKLSSATFGSREVSAVFKICNKKMKRVDL